MDKTSGSEILHNAIVRLRLAVAVRETSQHPLAAGGLGDLASRKNRRQNHREGTAATRASEVTPPDGWPRRDNIEGCFVQPLLITPCTVCKQ